MQTLIFIIKILLVVVPVLLIIVFTIVAERKTTASMQKRLGLNKAIHIGIMQKYVYTLKLLLAFFFKIILIKFFCLNTHLLVDYLLCTIPVNLIRLKTLSFYKISSCIIFSIIIFYVKSELAMLIPIIAVSLPWDAFHMNANNKVSITNLLETPGKVEYQKTYELLSNGRKKNIDFDFPQYVPGSIDQDELGKLLAIIVYERYDLHSFQLIRATLSPSGHDYLKGFLKENNPDMYHKGYVDIKPNCTPGLNGKVGINNVLDALNNVCEHKRPRKTL